MRICPVGAELLHTDMTKRNATFHNFATVPNTIIIKFLIPPTNAHQCLLQ